jgi:signal transduction histidine kinase
MTRSREQILRELHQIATTLPRLDSVETICERTVEAAESVLEFDHCVIMLAEDDRMRLVALSEDFPGPGFDSLPVEDSLAGHTYRTGESVIVDDASNHPLANPQGPYESGLSLPVGDHGTCQMVFESEGAFDEDDRELAELLVSHTQAALDRVKREAELRERNERLDEFVSVVSHDLRNPLNVATGRLELARAECESEHLDDVDRALSRMDTLVDDLLALAREGTHASDLEPVAVADICRDCWETVATADASLVVEADSVVRADRTRFRQLLENLVRNAVEHGGDDVTITVGDLDDGFYVADDGPGLPETEPERVFEGGYSTTESGTGFGLKIVREVVTAHGWTITATESDDGGARFDVTDVEVVA